MSTSSTVINLRTPPAQRELIDRAARVEGKTRTEFMLDASRERAQQVLLDRTAFVATAKQHEAFLAVIDAPLAKNEGVKRLLARRTPWEK